MLLGRKITTTNKYIHIYAYIYIYTAHHQWSGENTYVHVQVSGWGCGHGGITHAQTTSSNGRLDTRRGIVSAVLSVNWTDYMRPASTSTLSDGSATQTYVLILSQLVTLHTCCDFIVLLHGETRVIAP